MLDGHAAKLTQSQDSVEKDISESILLSISEGRPILRSSQRVPEHGVARYR
jgi:hypothetical protein